MMVPIWFPDLPRGVQLYTSVQQSRHKHVQQSNKVVWHMYGKVFRCTTKLSYMCTTTLWYTGVRSYTSVKQSTSASWY